MLLKLLSYLPDANALAAVVMRFCLLLFFCLFVVVFYTDMA